MSKSPAVFDIQKLRWMNGEYLKGNGSAKHSMMAEPYLKKALTKELGSASDRRDGSYPYRGIPGYHRRWSAFFETGSGVRYRHCSPTRRPKTDAETAACDLTGICFRGLRLQETFTNDALFEMLEDLYAGEWLQGQLL